MFILSQHVKGLSDTSGRHGLRLLSSSSAQGYQLARVSAQPKPEAVEMMSPLIRKRVLNALECPPRVLMLLATVSDYMEALQVNTAPCGLELLAGMMGHPGQPKFAQRVLDEKQQWEARLNIQTCEVKRGQRNVRRSTEFFDNRLNDAANWIAQQISADRSSLHTLARIDDYCETAIIQFLRKPLKAAKTTTTRSEPHLAVQGESVISSDVTVLSASGELALSLLRQGFRVFPVDVEAKRPRVTVWQQRHSERTIRDWSRRWSDTAWGIACGAPRPQVGYLAVLDKDRHGPTFGDGFKTVTLRENDLGPLPMTLTITTHLIGEHSYFWTTKPLPTTHDLLGPGLDLKGQGGFVVAPGSPGYEVTRDLPIEQLPTAWERALEVVHHPKKTITEGGRHDYLRATSYALACNGKGVDEILRTLRQRWEFNCEKRGRVISDDELQQLAVSAAAKVSRANYMLDLISA